MASKNRKERRSQDPIIQTKNAEFLGGAGAAGNANINGPLGVAVGNGFINNPPKSDGTGGWGVAGKKSKPAGGTTPLVNPFNPIKGAGLTNVSQTFPSNFFLEWDLSLWRTAIDRTINLGDPTLLATLYQWIHQCSPFYQSMKRTISAFIDQQDIFCVDPKGAQLDDWTQEISAKTWFKAFFLEIVLSNFTGFSGLNFDPANEKVFRYPMQDLDPINRMLRGGTYDYFNGDSFEECINLLFVQPDPSIEGFCGWNSAISRMFIMINENIISWLAAGKRVAFPFMTVGYPQDDGEIDPVTNQQINDFKRQAEDVLANADPFRGLAYPYTLDAKGNIIKSLEVGFESPGANAKAYTIYNDFNETAKNEIRELIMGGSLTADVGNSGSRALGEVQERKLMTFLRGLIEFGLTVVNGKEFQGKICKFYKNYPTGNLRFDINRSKEMTIDEIVAMSNVLAQAGKRFTDAFFEANGLIREFFEDAPTPAAGQPNEENPLKAGDISKKDMKSATTEKKKTFSIYR